MNNVSPWRLGFIGAIALICAYMVLPSARYLAALNDEAADAERVEELREGAIPLGLDLRGGVDVTLRIDDDKARKEAVANFARTLRDNMARNTLSASVAVSEDGESILVKASDAADSRQIANTIRDYEALTGEVSEEALAAGSEVRLQIRQEELRGNLHGTMQSVEKIIRERLDKFGLSQPAISVIGENRIRIQVPGEKDPDRLISNLTTLAKMEFRLAHEQYGTANDPIQQMIDPATGELKPDAIVPLGYEVLPYKFGTLDRKTGAITYSEGKMLVSKTVNLTGDGLRQTGVIQDPSSLDNPIKVSLQFKDEGSRIFEDLTRQSVERMRTSGSPDHLCIVLDGVVRSSPRLGVVIAGGSAVIEGGFTFAEADDLSKLLKAGSLPAPLVPESKRAVGPSLGEESILSSVNALFYGTIAVVVFMIAYYSTAGVIAVVAVVLNVMIVLATMALSKATLTLAGIGGILLTVGMAVDANVLIYERIREEIEAGRSVRQAIMLGFGRAFGVIFDSNLTTLMTALVLLQFGEGSVRGFALTMTFGLIANLFTGLTVTHALCSAWFQWRGKLGLGVLRIPVLKFDYISARYVSGAVSAATVVIALALVLMQGGLRFGVDFAGGMIADVRFSQAVSENDIRDAVRAAGLDGERVQGIAGTNDHVIRVKLLENVADDAGGPTAATEKALLDGLRARFGAESLEVLSIDSFGSETGQEFRTIAITVTLLASIAILLYLWFRFELTFGVAAVLALIHDLVITVLVSTLWGVEISLDVVAALMVLLGFSVNDTIVIFDRIRENTRKGGTRHFREICNLSMNQSLARSLITTGTVFMTVLVLLLVGGEGLAPFAKVLVVGTIVGSYSSIFFATPIVYFWNERTKGAVATALLENKTAAAEARIAQPGAAQRGVAGVPKTRI